MAAAAWSFYNSFREYLGTAGFDLTGTSDGFYMALHTSAASAKVNTATLSTQASLANEVASGNGYTTGGASVTSRTWAAGASAGAPGHQAVRPALPERLSGRAHRDAARRR